MPILFLEELNKPNLLSTALAPKSFNLVVYDWLIESCLIVPQPSDNNILSRDSWS